MRVLSISITAAGAALARRLPYEHRHGGMVEGVGAAWDTVDGLVLFAATGIAVRAIAPLLSAKTAGPVVVCADDRGDHVIALVGGHRGANDLASDVAAALSAVPVVSTATDLAGLPALDRLPGYRAAGDVASVTRAWLDGAAPRLQRTDGLAGWTVPFEPGPGGAVTITDHNRPPAPGEVLLRPPSLVVGTGASRDADPESLLEATETALSEAGLHPWCVGAVATADIKAAEPAVVALARHFGVPLSTHPAAALAAQAVPNPSDVVSAAVGTPSVAEAAALLTAGPGGGLVVEKRVSAGRDSTVAVARRARPAGHLAVVGLGPGHPDRRTPEATAAVRHADVVIGYELYVEQAADLLGPAQEVVRSPIGAEAERTRQALHHAAHGRRVALVCSGDPGVYAMASLACELAPEHGDPPITVVPGVTAALSGAALLGAPLGHDHASVSLSDLLTPWPVIAGRLEAVARGDFVVSLYNPRSVRRTAQLPEALAILGRHRPPSTPAAVLTEIGRPAQKVLRTTLADLDPADVGMLSLVVVGSSRTRWIGDRMVTPRGYQL